MKLFQRSIPRYAWLAASAVLLVLLASYAWESAALHVKDRFLPRRFAEVEPGAIYRSGQIDARIVRDVLHDHAIAAVIDLQQPEGNPNQRAEADAVRELAVEYRSFPMPGNGCAEPAVLAQAVAALADARRRGKPVLVHCTAGSRRTGAVLALYLELVERRPDAAERELTRVDGGEGRIATLRRHLDDHRAEIERLLLELGAIRHADARDAARPLPERV